MALNQDNRLIHIDTPLGKDTFIATQLNGEESVSSPFSFDVRLQSDKLDLDQKDLMGKAVTITLSYGDAGNLKQRYIHGYVSRLAMLDAFAEGVRNYHITVVPGLWFTALASNNRVFHDMSAKDILQSLFGEYSKVLKTDFKLQATYLTREYCVQFDETDFDFASRLMAEEGISYYFEHEKGKHTLVLCDDAQGFYDCDTDPIEYVEGGSLPSTHHLNHWQRDFNYHSGGFEFKDYNEFTTTKDNKIQVKTTNPLNDSSNYLLRMYGLNHFESDANKHKFKDAYHKQVNEVAMEAQESGFEIANGKGNVTTFAAGGRFTLDHRLKTEKGKYLITQNRITATDGHSDGTVFSNQFQCIPAKTTPRPAPGFFKKQIPYPQVAEILEVKATASDSSEDSFTQVKVKFPWNSKQNSCWMRVMQAFAGKNWGANFVPRIGQEVVISYINGDPDRPLVTGAVYNGTNTGPNYTATQSGWKTEYDSSEFNELRFDDKKGSEEIYMEAGKDHNWLVHNDQNGEVENDQTLKVKNNRTITVTDGNESTTIAKGDQSYTVSKGNQDTSVKGNQTIKVDGNREAKVGGSHKEDVGSSQTVKVGTSQATKAGTSIEIKAGTTMKLEATASMELKVGGSSIKLTPAGIEMKGVMFKAEGSAMAEVKAGAMLTLKGGITMIN